MKDFENEPPEELSIEQAALYLAEHLAEQAASNKEAETARLRHYGGEILEDGTLQMRDPNDNAGRRYQYRLINGSPCRKVSPNEGDYDPPAEWELFDVTALATVTSGYHPILEYFNCE